MQSWKLQLFGCSIVSTLSNADPTTHFLPTVWYLNRSLDLSHSNAIVYHPMLSDILQTIYLLLLPTNFKQTSKSGSRTNRQSSTSVWMAIFILSPREAALFQADVNLVNDWVCNNHLTINANKTKFMLISRRRNLPKNFPPLYINNIQIESVSHFKYLGVWILKT